MSTGAPEEFGPYIVYEEIGMGGMAAVHRAETRGIEGFRKPVALKRMLPSVAANGDFVEAFIREARIASHLRHVNVAQTYELGKVDGIYFIAMELVTGRNPRQILRHCAQLTGQMPVAVTLNILNQICDALDYAHNLADSTGTKLGIIHRDVSPSNIIVSEEGVVKLIDFGIAKASAAGMQTMSGMLKGKFGYMAPEYIAGTIDARADLFALGVIAHELLTNRPLFSSNDDMETLNRVRNMPIKPPSARNPKVPKEIDELVMTALERNPDRRWQHATALRNALTTMTQRLKMDVMNGEVAEWIDWVFEQGKRDDFTMTIQDATEVDPPGHATVASRTPLTTVRARPEPDLDLRATTRREPSAPPVVARTQTPPNVPAPVSAGLDSGSRPVRTLLGSMEPGYRGSAPNISLAALRQSSPQITIPQDVKEPTPNPAFARTPSIPPHPGFGAGSVPGHVQAPTPGVDATKIVEPISVRGVATPGPRSTGSQKARKSDGLGLIAFLVIVVAAATVVVLYFALT